MNITLHRRTVIYGLLLLAGVIALLIMPPLNRPPHVDPIAPFTAPTRNDPATPAQVEADPAQAAAQFLRTFYTADYRDRAHWLAALKPLSSVDGYSLLKNLIAPALWKDLERTQTVVTAAQVMIEAGDLKAEGVSKLVGNTPWQIRAVTITLAADARWPGWTSTTHSTNILLSQENGAWKFVMVMSDDQVKMFQPQSKGVR